MTIRFGKVEPLPNEGSRQSGCHRPSTSEARLYWQEAGRFLVREGREIVVDPVEGVEERVLRLYVLGPAMAILLHQRGFLVLHASAVDVNGGAVAFLGGAGWGKSTTAAALNARGHALVADDVVALAPDGDGSPILYSGFPQLKLWPEVAASLGNSPETMPRLHPKLDKLALRSIQKFSREPLPLKRLYVLEESPALETEAIRPQEALVELVRHTYCVRVLQAEETSSHFLQCADLVRAIPVRRLKRPNSISRLSDIARLVEDETSRESQGALRG